MISLLIVVGRSMDQVFSIITQKQLRHYHIVVDVVVCCVVVDIAPVVAVVAVVAFVAVVAVVAVVAAAVLLCWAKMVAGRR